MSREDKNERGGNRVGREIIVGVRDRGFSRRSRNMLICSLFF